MMSHQTISFMKSGLRIIGYVWLVTQPLAAVIALVIAEILGVWEEVGE